MKKYVLILFVIIFSFFQINHANAQLRPYLEPAAVDSYGDPIRANLENPVVGPLGQPICCESSNEFNFTLTFSGFSNLIALENQIITAQRVALDRWLRNQEETFRKEINRQMGENYSSFSTAQKEYFKFYEGGSSGNRGPVEKARQLLSNNSQWTRNWEEEAKSNILKSTVLDSWINCGYCDEYRDMAYEIGGLAQFDNDSGPGPKFYAQHYSDEASSTYGEAFYTSNLNNLRAEGFREMLEGDYLLNRLSNIRVSHYRSLSWQERVFLMSAYLINNNINCGTPTFSCLPRELWEYKPPQIWSDEILSKWAIELGSEIPFIPYVFSDEYSSEPISYFVNLFGPYSYGYYATHIPETRELVSNELLRIPEENKICGGISWTEIGDAYYTTLSGLRLTARGTILGFPVGPRTFINIPNICIQIPNFDYDDNQEVLRPSHVATQRLKLAWEAAVIGLTIDETLIEITGRRNPTEAEYGAALLRNLNIAFQGLRTGSTATFGYCRGSNTSVVRYCR